MFLLWDNQIGDKGCTALSTSLPHLTNLPKLILYDNQIGDKGCIALSTTLPHLTNLQKLGLDRNRITFEEKKKFNSLHEKQIKTLKKYRI